MSIDRQFAKMFFGPLAEKALKIRTEQKKSANEVSAFIKVNYGARVSKSWILDFEELKYDDVTLKKIMYLFAALNEVPGKDDYLDDEQQKDIETFAADFAKDFQLILERLPKKDES